MKRAHFILIVLGGLLLFLSNAMPASALQIVAESRFNIPNDLDGWTFPPSHIYTFWSNIGQADPADGYVRFIDPDNSSGGHIDAPGKFLGDWSALDGVGRLDYDFKVFQSDTSTLPADPYNVTIYGFDQFGNSMSATWFSSLIPSRRTPWVTLNIPIAMSTWGITDSAAWTSLLSNVTGLRIDFELFNNSALNDERAGVDNVILWGPDMAQVPEPSTLLLLGSGIAGLAFIRRRFKG